MKKTLVFMLLSVILTSMSSDKRAYQYFNNKGKAIDFDKVMSRIEDADIVFFGELHNNAIAHWMELETAKYLYSKKADKLIMGAEMYESDQQLIVNEFLADEVAYKYFKDQARLWKNDETDYYPILDFARDKKIPFIATNVPRRYAAIVNNSGFEGVESLSPGAKEFMAPLPIVYDGEVACYKNMLTMMGGHGGPKMANIPKAQALKDATMAHFILKNWNPGKQFFHFNGSYHSENHEGIIWYLKQQNPGLKIVTITTVEQAVVEKLDEEHQSKADFILVVDETLTKTY